MEIKIKIEKKHLYFLSILILIASVGIVIAKTSGWPTTEKATHSNLVADKIASSTAEPVIVDDDLTVNEDLTVTGTLTANGGITANGQITANGGISGIAWVVPSQIKSTSTKTHKGNFGGYKSMHTWIQTNGCNGYHVCDGTEITRYIQKNGNLAVTGWYNGGVAAYNNVNRDCKGWTQRKDGSYYIQGTYWDAANMPETVFCDTAKPVLCCK